jgi:hypothetical protein
MRYVWLSIIGLSLVPVATVCFLMNPMTLFVLGAEAWRERLTRLYPYRWWLVAALAALATSTFVYGTQYT